MKKLRAAFIDIETRPNEAFVWGKYEQNVIAFIDEGALISFAYKELGKKKVHAYALPDFPLYKKDKRDDHALVQKLWEVFNDFDVLIAHNGDQFDIKKANAYFAHHGMKPPTLYRTIDTKKVAKAAFKLNSNKLDDIGNYFGLGRKIQTGGFQLWLDCIDKTKYNKTAWDKMVRYNKQDVVLLEKVYLKMLPWIKNHPNVNVLSDAVGRCPNCGSEHLQKRGFWIVGKKKVQKYQCQNIECGAWNPESKVLLKITK